MRWRFPKKASEQGWLWLPTEQVERESNEAEPWALENDKTVRFRGE